MQRKLKYWSADSSQSSVQRNNLLKRNLQQGAPAWPTSTPVWRHQHHCQRNWETPKAAKSDKSQRTRWYEPPGPRGSCIRDFPVTNPDLQSLYEVWHSTKGLEICLHRTRVQERGTIKAWKLPAHLPQQHTLQASWARSSQHYHGTCGGTPDPAYGAAWLSPRQILWVPVAASRGWCVWSAKKKGCQEDGLL